MYVVNAGFRSTAEENSRTMASGRLSDSLLLSKLWVSDDKVDG